MYVFELPPRQSCKIRVSLELRYVMNWSCFFYIFDKAEITLPNYNKPRLIFIPYFNVAPVAPVFFALYEPARSTKKNLAVIYPY
jgi:hypothetical protein